MKTPHASALLSKIVICIYLVLSLLYMHARAQIQTGASNISEYIEELKGKRVGLVVNQTSMVNGVHLVDTLLKLGVKISCIFAPEHGFRGEADAGSWVKNGMDLSTGIPILSLYGKNKKPSGEQLKDLDLVVFDIQDVGVRFYTYISTMHLVMEACAENKKPLIVLDRPNPNGHRIEGPVLDTAWKSFVGMHPIPLVHGLTVGELAQMIVGEKWLKEGLSLRVVTCKKYKHALRYSLPVRPSPNLPNALSIQLYPSLGLTEGTILSIGRGTDFPFQVIGYPGNAKGTFCFVPQSQQGASDPLYRGLTVCGEDLRNESLDSINFGLKYIIKYYHLYPSKSDFFKPFFNKLIGNEWVMKLIIEGKTEQEISAQWQRELDQYKKLRKKYLLYPD